MGLHRLLSSGVVVTLKTLSFQPGDVAGQVGQRLPAVPGQASAGGHCPPAQPAGGGRKRDVAWGHSSVCIVIFQSRGAVRPPGMWSLSSPHCGPPPPSGQPQGEGLAHLRQSQRLSALAGFARVLRCGTECELPALAAMPGRSPRLEHSPPSKCRESRGCQPLFPGFENSAPVVTMSCLQWIYK